MNKNRGKNNDMHVMQNYPITPNSWVLDNHHIFSYLQTFAKHYVICHIKDGLLVSRHIYNDGLVIKLYWYYKCENARANIGYISRINTLISHVQEHQLALISFEYESHSIMAAQYAEDAEEKFMTMLKSHGGLITEDEYTKYEYILNSKCSIPDIVFDIYTQRTMNNIMFNKYLEDNGIV